MGFEPHAIRQRKPVASEETAPPASPRGMTAGQLYVSDPEPELGLGVIIGVDEKSVEVLFAAADETRRYVTKSAPLQRVRFTAGDAISDVSGKAHRVSAVEERAGVLYYTTEHGELAEARIAARTAVAGPRT